MAARRRFSTRARAALALTGVLALGPLLIAGPDAVGRPASAAVPANATAPALATAPVLANAPAPAALVPAPDKEEGTFTLPLTSTHVQKWQGEVAVFDLTRLISEENRKNLDMSTVQLSVAQGSEGTSAAPAVVSKNLLSVTIPGVGEWRIEDSTVRFIPRSGSRSIPVSVNLQIRNTAGEISTPAQLTAIYPYAPDLTLSAPEGVTRQISLGLSAALVQPDSVELTLEGMPTGTALADGGQTMIVPQEGTWSVVNGTDELRFVPLRDRMGQQPTPVHYRAIDNRGRIVGPGTVTLQVPVITDVVRSAPYGETVEFDLAPALSNIDRNTVELIPYADENEAQVSQNGATVNVADQGVWRLDRATGRLFFTPLSSRVTDVTDMGVRGRDQEGNLSSIAPVRVGYPQVSSPTKSFVWGEVAEFSPLLGAINVRPESFAFDTANMPAGTTLSEDAKTMRVPNEGVWQLDSDTYDVSFIPIEALKKNPTPVTYSIKGIYADNPTRGVLTAQYADAVPQARDDEAATANATDTLVIDVLANDTPASAAQAFDASTLQLHSAYATNISDLVGATGERLVIPSQGTFQVTDAGAVEFTPASGFRGQTTPVDYIVQDSQGLRTLARITVDVNQQMSLRSNANQDSGINALLGRLFPSTPSTFSLFASLTALLCFTGVVSLWVGRRMERGADSD